MKKRNLALILALVMLLTACVAGTLAWLQDKTDPVVNTFTVGNIDIDLTETTGSEYKMIPGNTISKDPFVTVKVGSEACYVFVKIEESTDPKFDDYMTYGIADGWTVLEGVDGVYYREQAYLTGEGAEDADYPVLLNNKVTVKTSVTKEMMDALQAAYNAAKAECNDCEGTEECEECNKTLPQLTFTAYAVQKANVDSASDAWEILFPPVTP